MYFTKYMWIYLFEKKIEVFAQFKRFKLLIKKQIECSVKRLRVGGRGEYISNEFVQFIEKEGIEHEIIALHTPKHNDIVERDNIGMLNMERSILKSRKMLKSL